MDGHEKSWRHMITNRSVFIPKVDACQCSRNALFRGVVILQSKRRVKKRRNLTEYVRAARKWP